MPFKNLDDIEEIDILPKIKVKFIHSKNMTLAYWNIQTGATFPNHSHPHEQVATMLEGEFEFKVGDEKRIMKEGDVAIVPPNVTHSGIALTDCNIIDVFFPTREDYVKLTGKNKKKN
ncbi:MAG: Cupin domain protein [Candidatus Methanofastidiosum methylothiophilum]|uniref:Cupin domain protein n=1 Tax=Candidatus Methanofastidiosum methylothiophilum TaxID=1705564 RepID=A0A150II84_9EURY|nr:MAG: Cupin domain protein [Candidatus Methanofastidiosum methylthiophilus]